MPMVKNIRDRIRIRQHLRYLLAAILAATSAGSLAQNFCQIEHDHDEDSVQTRAEAMHVVHWRDKLRSSGASPDAWVRFKILGFNDFHG